MQCSSRCFIFQKVHSESEPNKQVKTQNLLGFSIFSLIYKRVKIFFAMPVFLSTCYKKNIVVTTNQKCKGFTAISISAKSRSPTAVHFERLQHAVGREKGPHAICALELQQRLQLQSQATVQCSACFIGHFLKDSAHRWNARKLIHFVDIEAIFLFSGYKCKYLVGIEGSSLLATSNKR